MKRGDGMVSDERVEGGGLALSHASAAAASAEVTGDAGAAASVG